MAGGYFDDGTVQVALGAHVFATPAARRSNLLMTPFCSPALALHVGGGVLELTVTGQTVRDNLGDAERYAAELLRALATSGPGALGVEDNLGRRSAFANSVCTGAVAEVRAFRFVEVKFDFACPEAPDDAAWGGLPDAPDAYAGTSTLQDYAAGGVALGIGGTHAHRDGAALPGAAAAPRPRRPRVRAPERRPPAPDRHRPHAGGGRRTWPRRSGTWNAPSAPGPST